MKKKIGVGTVVGIILMCAACTQRSNWYDYGNGYINLDQVTRVSSSTNIDFNVTSKEYNSQKNWNSFYNNLSEEDRAVQDAHLDYCYDKMHANNGGGQRYGYEWPAAWMHGNSIGSFISGKNGRELASMVFSLKSGVTEDFAAHCVIVASGTASIDFDGFTVRLPDFKFIYDAPPEKDKKVTNEDAQSIFIEKMGVLAVGKTPWNDEYESIKRKFSK